MMSCLELMEGRQGRLYGVDCGIKQTWDRTLEGLEVGSRRDQNGNIELKWKWGKRGEFTTKSAYLGVRGGSMAERNLRWRRLWKLKVPYRCRMFLWVTLQKRLLTSESRVKRGLHDGMRCSIWGGEREDTIHMLRECKGMRALWDSLILSQFQNRFYRIPLDRWLWMNITCTKKVQGFDWNQLFAITCWKVWRRRNEKIFEDEPICLGHSIRR